MHHQHASPATPPMPRYGPRHPHSGQPMRQGIPTMHAPAAMLPVSAARSSPALRPRLPFCTGNITRGCQQCSLQPTPLRWNLRVVGLTLQRQAPASTAHTSPGHWQSATAPDAACALAPSCTISPSLRPGGVCVGCNVTRRSPRQGDVRLVPLQGTVSATSPCDAAHLGGVELFNRGRWGRLGVHRNDFLTAQVVCRQLGFPFWSLYATGSGDPTPARPGTPRALVWASRVTCTGRESRLTDCEFPAGVLGSASVPDPATVGARFDRRDTSHFGVICRRFEITGAASRRRRRCTRTRLLARKGPSCRAAGTRPADASARCL